MELSWSRRRSYVWQMLLIYAFMLVLNQVFSDIFLGYTMVYACIWFVFTDSYWTWNIFSWFTCQECWFSIGSVKLPEGIGVSLRLTLKIWNHLKSHGLSSSKLKLTWIGSNILKQTLICLCRGMSLQTTMKLPGLDLRSEWCHFLYKVGPLKD